MGITSHLSSDGSELTITIDGRFDFSQYREFRQAYSQGTPSIRYKINLSGVDYMDSAALGMLLLMRDHAGGDAASISLVGYSERIRKILEISRFDVLFNLRSAA